MHANVAVYKRPTTFHKHFKQVESLTSPDEFTEFFKCLVSNSEQWHSYKCEKNELCLYEVNHNNIGHIEERRSNSYSLPETNFSQWDQVVFLHFLKVCLERDPVDSANRICWMNSDWNIWVLPSRRRLCDEQTNRSSRGRDSSKERNDRAGGDASTNLLYSDLDAQSRLRFILLRIVVTEYRRGVLNNKTRLVIYWVKGKISEGRK